MNAKEFILHWRKEKDIRQGTLNWPVGLWQECMEAYHRAKVEAVTDEEIYKMFPLPKNVWRGEYAEAKRSGAIILRDKLLNQ